CSVIPLFKALFVTVLSQLENTPLKTEKISFAFLQRSTQLIGLFIFVIKNAFQCFDEDNNVTISEERLRELLTTMGDRYTDEQVDELFRDAPIKNGRFDYMEFTRVLKHGTKEKDEEKAK
uniref:EF-hand domain-containing protein n=2 Tax=Meloidogyne TaxID=189290 RepID=A0A915NGA1_9BILA